jgi:VWFA-related protein
MRARHRWLAAVVLAGVAGAALRSESRQNQKPFRAEIDLVMVTATVLDREGRTVTNLAQSDFTVREDGVPQDIAFFVLDDRTPLSLVVLVDTSGSMEDKLDDVQDALRHLHGTLKAEDEMALLEFSTGVSMAADFGATPESVRRAIGRLSARGGTALFDAILDGLDTLTRGRNRKKALVVITDGNDNTSRVRLRDVTDALASSETVVYCLGIGHGARGSFGHGSLDRSDIVDIKTLRAIAEPSGGRAQLLENAHRGKVDLVDEAVLSMTAELTRQYTLGYYPTRATKDGSYRRIDVTATNTQLTVRARRGYRAPSR